MKITHSSLAVVACWLAACSTVVGADFDNRRERSAAGSGGKSENTSTGGSGAHSNGGVSSAGANGLGGSASSGAAGMAGNAGSSDAGSAGASQGGSAGEAGTNGGVANGGVANGGAANAGQSNGGQPNAGAANGGNAGGGGTSGGAANGGQPSAGAANGGSAGGAFMPNPVVVLNEVKGQGSGDDFIEIYNRGPGSADLEGYGLSDSNNTLIFPASTTLAQGGFLLLLLGQTDTGPAPSCFVPNQACFHATWGISQNGEMVYFRGRQNQVLDSTMYPDQAGANGITNAETWGRFPDGSGGFVANRPTPEAPNQLP